MGHHVPGNMVSAAAHCHKCKRKTQHRVDNHVVTNVCLECPKRGALELVAVVSIPVEVPAPCTCKKYPFAHYHAIQKHGDSYPRFRPGTWEENRA